MTCYTVAECDNVTEFYSLTCYTVAECDTVTKFYSVTEGYTVAERYCEIQLILNLVSIIFSNFQK